MRILWVLSKLEWDGGIGRVVAASAQALAARGHEAHVAGSVTGPAPGPLPGVEVHPWRKRHLKLRHLAPLVAIQRSVRADVIHFHSALPHGEVILGLRALRPWLGRPRIFVTAHSSRPYPKRRARLGLRVADAVIEASSWAAESAIRAGAHRETTHVVPAGIDAFPAGSETREPVIVTLTRLVGMKGLDVLIEAFDRVAPAHPEWRLQIAGTGSAEAELRACASAAACAERIEFPGYVRGTAKQELLQSASIGALPSLRESFGGVLLEFQANGLACVASDVGALPELAGNGETARLVSPGDPEALAKALGELMDDPELRRAMGAAGRRQAAEFTWPRVAERLERLYAS
jgi:glycosyltransferase involved in cell wall biosynthesis